MTFEEEKMMSALSTLKATEKMLQSPTSSYPPPPPPPPARSTAATTRSMSYSPSFSSLQSVKSKVQGFLGGSAAEQKAVRKVLLTLHCSNYVPACIVSSHVLDATSFSVTKLRPRRSLSAIAASRNCITSRQYYYMHQRALSSESVSLNEAESVAS